MMNKTTDFDIEQTMMDSYFGKTISEIISWYPKIITRKSVFQYLMQTQSNEEVLSILKYDEATRDGNGINSAIVSDDVYYGFLDLMIVLEELAKRLMALYYYSEIWLSEKLKQAQIFAKQIDYQQFLDFCEMTKDKHYITPAEYQQLIEDRQSGIMNHDIEKYVYSYSLYEKIGRDETISENDKYKKILDLYDANYSYNFINFQLPALRTKKLLNKNYFYERIFNTSINLNNLK